MSKTDPVNIANPAGSSDPKFGDDYIRTLARAVIEIVNKDHYVGSVVANAYSEDAAGEHSKVTLNAPLAVHPTNAVNKAHLYIKDVDGVAELFFQDENGKYIQITRYLADLTSKIQSINADVLALSNGVTLKGLSSDGSTLVDIISVGRNDADDTDVAVLPDKVRKATNAEASEDTELICLKHFTNNSKVVQVVNVKSTTSLDTAVAIPHDNTVPQNNEGLECMSLAITPVSATNRLRVDVTALLGNSAAYRCIAALFKNSDADALMAGSNDSDTTERGNCAVTFSYFMTAGTTDEMTFKVRFGSPSATAYFNGIYGAAGISSITITEIRP